MRLPLHHNSWERYSPAKVDELLDWKDIEVLRRLRLEFHLTELYLRYVLSASKEQLGRMQELGLVTFSDCLYTPTGKGRCFLDRQRPDTPVV